MVRRREMMRLGEDDLGDEEGDVSVCDEEEYESVSVGESGLRE
ncbi:uncharacterized protein G2W53_032802 [Senna tora]|uniref:Uncharacterized protein n=1 Tax=Senna tora TaxID=362788 RepID=A0A834SY16_9FABA|nr:uncharacterized protein G2W53_032802 [Senna tora]